MLVAARDRIREVIEDDISELLQGSYAAKALAIYQ